MERGTKGEYKMNRQIWFDMDGTLADLYGVENWLPKLRACDASPYENAAPLVRMQSLARMLNRLQREGYEIGVISWLSKNSTAEYAEMVTDAKRKWLRLHLKSVNFNYVDIVAYGTPKSIGREGILFDDEEQNRAEWGENAYDVHNIIETLKAL